MNIYHIIHDQFQLTFSYVIINNYCSYLVDIQMFIFCVNNDLIFFYLLNEEIFPLSYLH
jgi:hypothetical protein